MIPTIIETVGGKALVLAAMGLIGTAAGCITANDLDGVVFACNQEADCAPDLHCHPTLKICVAEAIADGDAGGDDGGDADVPDVETTPDTDVETDADAAVGLDPNRLATAEECKTYCKIATAQCQNALGHYRDLDHCLDYCEDIGQWAIGSPDATTGNTLACRLTHAESAGDDAETNCPMAGPLGGGACGEPCENYCDAVDTLCDGPNAIYDSSAQCETVCKSFDDDAPTGQFTGDTLQCRHAYLSLADLEKGGRNVFCNAAAAFDGACAANTASISPNCTNYCAVVDAGCSPTDDGLYETPSDCMQMCSDWAKFPEGTGGDGGGNSIACRLIHASDAFKNHPELHCPVARYDGHGVCGTWCENYCSLAIDLCIADDAIFDSPAACAIECAAISTEGAVGDEGSDTVQCRLTHIIEAASSPNEEIGGHCAVAGNGPERACNVPVPSVATYCEDLFAACGATSPYPSIDACKKFCSVKPGLDLGQTGDTSGNTVACRQTFTDAKQCAAAGPAGGNICGSWCDVYCDLAADICGSNAKTELYESAAECHTTCVEFTKSAPPNTMKGNSAQCRINHLLIGAFATGPDTVQTVATVKACAAASEDSTIGTCVD